MKTIDISAQIETPEVELARLRAKVATLEAAGGAVTVTHSTGVSKKTGRAYSGFNVKVGALYPIYVSDAAMDALVLPDALAALVAAHKAARRK